MFIEVDFANMLLHMSRSLVMCFCLQVCFGGTFGKKKKLL